MSGIGVVFSFDRTYVLPALISSMSLLDAGMRKGEREGYSLYFLTESELPSFVIDKYEKYLFSYSNCLSVKFLVSEEVEGQAYESRHLTRAAYLRLEIPEVLDLDRVFYSDVDVLYLSGLESLWSLDISDVYLAATLDAGLNLKRKFSRRSTQFPYWEKYFKGRQGSYFQSGFLLMNLNKLRDADMVSKWRELEKESFNYHDMDIINITCYPYIRKIGSQYNVMPGFLCDGVYERGLEEGFLEEEEVRCVRENPVMIHYAGVEKPWKNYSSLGSCEYWRFVKQYPGLVKDFREKYPCSLFNKLKSFFVRPLF